MSTALALSLPVSLAAALWVLCQYLQVRDAREAAERQELLQRIQAPELAVTQHAAPKTEIPAHLPFDDDSAWTTYTEETRERVANG